MTQDASRPQVKLNPAKLVRRIPLLPHQWLSEITPERDVFVLSHLGTPDVDVSAWALDVTGLVKRPRRFTLEDIRRMPKRQVRAFHQCAGYPRNPTLATRRLANVVWGGVDLAALLAGLELAPDARFLWSYGLDYGEYDGVEAKSYLKDMPLTRLAAGGVLLAYELDGQPLCRDHGFPLRLVVPGYYGTNSVKWLYRLALAGRLADGPFTTDLYNDAVPPSAEWPDGRKPVWEVAPESAIVVPAPEAVVAGETVEIWGWAWADSEIARVDVSTDGGETWRSAALSARVERLWQRFRIDWTPEKVGRTVLLSRATDLEGAVQPTVHARNALYPVPVNVEAAGVRDRL